MQYKSDAILKIVSSAFVPRSTFLVHAKLVSHADGRHIEHELIKEMTNLTQLLIR